MKKAILFFTFIFSAALALGQDSTSYYNIIANSQWIYVDLNDHSNADTYFVWYKKDLKDLMTDILIQKGITKVLKLNRIDQLNANDILLDLKIDTTNFYFIFDNTFNTSLLRKTRIITIELNIKKLDYLTGLNEKYMVTIGRKYRKPFIVQLPLYERDTNDQIIFCVEDLIYDFANDYIRAKK